MPSNLVGKADLNAYRIACFKLVSILARNDPYEGVSIDKVYLNLTDSTEAMLKKSPPHGLEVLVKEIPKSHVLGHENEVCGNAF
ncbi:hypothetical protein GH714_008404 [Hevea brasiliensis]|uniref:UmuC domain-containing protein n=1 Tax=Hevea brasiliensis TaxID=3981 RepID=A0A6A6LRA4_HEVBR|nr:hypothetical protein GH714_008404 [Hevea brasiliensis]